jgi:hypothetical protein
MRFRDLQLKEFAPPAPENQIGIDPQASAPTQPQPIQQINMPQRKAVATPIDSKFGEHVINLLRKTSKLPSTDPKKQFVDQLIRSIDAVATPVGEAIQSSTTNRALITRAGAAHYNAKLERVRALNPELAAEFERFVAMADAELGPVENDPKVKQSYTAAIKGITLNVQGEIAFKNKSIRDLADQKADALGMDRKWVRNLIGMFDVTISQQDQEEFLRLCAAGEALNIGKMIKMGSGSLDQVVVDHPPSIKEVFKSIKGTLLDITLSTGQGAATGPFEAMLAIMGSARKADKGDMEIDVNGVPNKFEVKSCSISSSFGHSNAWLDAPNEMPPATVKKYFETAMGKRPIEPGSNFRKVGIPALKLTLKRIKDPEARLQVLTNFHGSIFTSITDVSGYNFLEANKKILSSIMNEDYTEVAKQQMVMAMLEYMVGKENDGFIFYNSSFQTFQVIYGLPKMIEFAKNPEKYGVSALGQTMNMVPTATTRKGSPGVYFGPQITSPEGQSYKEKIKADPAWQKASAAKKATKARQAAQQTISK